MCYGTATLSKNALLIMENFLRSYNAGLYEGLLYTAIPPILCVELSQFSDPDPDRTFSEEEEEPTPSPSTFGRSQYIQERF